MADAHIPDEFFDAVAHHLPPEKHVGPKGGRPRVGHRTSLRVIWSVLITDGAAKQVFFDRHGKAAVRLGVRPDRVSELGLYAAGGRHGLGIGMRPDGSADLNAIDAEGRRRITLGIKPDGTPGLLIQDARGDDLFRTPGR